MIRAKLRVNLNMKQFTSVGCTYSFQQLCMQSVAKYTYVWYSYVCAFSVFGVRIPSKGCSLLFSSAIRYVVGRWPKPHSPFGLRVAIDMKSHQSHLTSLSNGYVMKANEIVEKKEIRLVSEFVWRCMRYWSLMLRFWIITTTTRSSRMNQVDFCDGKRKYAIVTTIYIWWANLLAEDQDQLSTN